MATSCGNGLGQAYLGKALCKGDLVALFHKVPDGERVLGSVSGGEALVGHVEEGEEGLLLL